MWLLWLLGVAAIVLVGVWAHNSQKAAAAKRREVLAAAAEEFMLESAIDPETATVTGRVDGYEVTFRLVTRGSGSNAESWTECEVRVDTHELDIALRPQTRREERWVEEGLARDVIVGNDEFDDKFIVEVAPEQLAIDALDELICAELLAHHPVEVKRTSDGLMFEKVGWLEEPEQIRRFGKMAALLAGNMDASVAAARDGEQRATAAMHYRGATPEVQRRGQLAAREETAALRQLRSDREEAQTRRVAMMTFWAVAAMVVVGILWALTLR